MTASRIFLYLCLLFIIGVFVYSLLKAPQENEELSSFYNQEINFIGIITGEPEQRINQQKFEFKSEEIQGKILITTEIYPEYQYGDKLEIFGKLTEPTVFDDFDYQAYLAKDKIYLTIYYPSIKLIEQNQGNWFFGKVFNFKDKLRKVIEQTLLPPQSSILKAVFLGDRFGLSNQLKEKLNISGTRHIVAISGMHMIIMTQILLFLGLGIGLWRSQVFYFVLILLVLYIIMIGAPASAVRAGIMAGLLLIAQKIGRLRSADRTVIFAATIMLLFNPLLLKSDVGFQLSFAATLSIIYLKPIFDKKTSKWPNPWRLKDILTMTLAAQLGTLPILIFHFGRLSLISPIANILIVPILSFIMIGGMILIFFGLIWLPLGKIIVWPIWFLLTYLVKVVNYLSSVPLATIDFNNISWFFLIGYYLILIWIIWQGNKKRECKILHSPKTISL
ncbi:MAG: ComEC/Rec2 family competence protein [Patescibacteria group bacterium]